MLRLESEEYIPEWLILPHIRYIEEYTANRSADDESDISEDVYLTEEQKIMKEKMLENLRQVERYRSTHPMIEEGKEYFVHHVPVEKYWERPNQISKPAGEDVIKEYLQVRDDALLTAEKQALQLSAVFAVIIVSLIRIFI